jgi:hypothetical protein
VLGLKPDPAKLGWDEYTKIGQWQRDLVLSDAAVTTMLGLLTKSGDLKSPGSVDRYLNLRYVRAANAQLKPR